MSHPISVKFHEVITAVWTDEAVTCPTVVSSESKGPHAVTEQTYVTLRVSHPGLAFCSSGKLVPQHYFTAVEVCFKSCVWCIMTILLQQPTRWWIKIKIDPHLNYIHYRRLAEATTEQRKQDRYTWKVELQTKLEFPLLLQKYIQQHSMVHSNNCSSWCVQGEIDVSWQGHCFTFRLGLG